MKQAILLASWFAAAFIINRQLGAAEAKPNILIIVADDLGFSDLGCYGGEVDTPQLDALAAGGVRLTRFYNTGRCCPSRASILTGQYPHRVGFGHMVQDLDQPGYTGRLPDDAATIGQVLEPAGYRSFIAGKWHLGGEDPTRHGFEEFYGTLVSAKTFWDPDHFLRMPSGRQRREYAAGEYYATDAVTDHALDFIHLARKTPDRPWLLYLAFSAPHFPLHAPQEDVARYADRYHVGWDAIRKERLARMKGLGIVPEDTPLTPRSRYWDWGETESRVNPPWDELPADRRADLARRMAIYAAMVDRMDRNIGRVVADLRETGELDDTLVVFLSDNGACAEWDPFGFDIRSSANNSLHAGPELEEMGGPGTFHSVGSGWANASNTPWRLYKHYNHEGGIASPCIVHWPARLKGGGRIVHEPAHIIDLMRTALEVTGAAYPRHETLPLPGRSLLPILAGEATEPRTLFFEHEGNRAVMDGRWKLVAVRGGPWELYDTETDRTELRDLATAHPDVVQSLAAKWDQWASENHVTPLPRDYKVGYFATDPP
jgi:arylsulfatase